MRHLEFLDILGRDPNLGRAAKQMNMSQPTASKLLKEVEDIFNVTLFTRNRRGMVPTDTGNAITRHALVMLEELRATQEEMASIALGATGRLRLGVFPVVVPEFLPMVRTQLDKTMPGMAYSLVEGAEYTLFAALSAGQLDCILGRVVAERLTPDLRHEVLYREPTVIVCGAGHAIVKAKKSALVSHLQQSDWLLPSPGGASFNLVASRLALEGLPAPRVQVESSSVLITIELLNKSPLLSVLSEKVARSYAAAGKLAIVPIELLASNYPVGVIYRRESTRTPLIRATVQAAKAAASAMSA